jgi:hypothetical protein
MPWPTTHRHEIKAQSNLQQGRNALARRIFHGKRGHLRADRGIRQAVSRAGEHELDQLFCADRGTPLAEVQPAPPRLHR